MSKRLSKGSSPVEKGKTYLGIVEDNMDPDRIGRCRIRVIDIHDGKDESDKYIIPMENLPWANPWKDLNGNSTNLPDKGKVVLVVFDDGNVMNPEYICSNHFNINLEKKLKELSDKDYLSMKSLIFDHKTQIYVNDSEGLKIDHKFNNINVRDKSIDINLKDNFGKINIGTPKATQRAILGDTFTNWLDEFLNILMGGKGGPFLGNFGAPVVATPALMAHIQLYQAIKDPKILSKNVYIVDNEDVAKQDRIADSTIGDNWNSTISENDITKKEDIDFKSVDGSTSTTFPPDGKFSTSAADPNDKTLQPISISEHPDVAIIKEVLVGKGYVIYDDVMKLNIVAVRNQCLRPGDKYTDEFVDQLYVVYKGNDGSWNVRKYVFSTVPGLKFTLAEEILKADISDPASPGDGYKESDAYGFIGKEISLKEYMHVTGRPLHILVPSQYVDSYELSGDSLVSRMGSQYLVWQDSERGKEEFQPSSMSRPESVIKNISIGKGFPGGKKIGYWGRNGNQCFATKEELSEFISLCSTHVEKYGNSLTYTLVTRSDFDEAVKAVQTGGTPDKKEEARESVVKDRPESRPSELKSDNLVMAFKIWANKNGYSFPIDASWSDDYSAKWSSLSVKWNQFSSGLRDDSLVLALAGLYPYGKVSSGGEVNAVVWNGKYIVDLSEGDKVMISDSSGNSLSEGTFEEGLKIISITAGAGAGKTIKDIDSMSNIMKMIGYIGG